MAKSVKVIPATLDMYGMVTVRDRDTMEQERVKIADLKEYFADKFTF